MNVRKFCTKVAKLLGQFERYWKQGEKENNYPSELSLIEWFEQLIAFLEMKGLA